MANGHGGARPGAGRKPGVVGEAKRKMQEAAREHGEAAVQLLVDVMNNGKESAKTRIDAANSLLDRGFGRPKQEMDLSSEDGSMSPTKMTRRVVDPATDGTGD